MSAPLLWVTCSWSVKVLEAVVGTEADVGAACANVTVLTVRVRLQVPASPPVSVSVPLRVWRPAANVVVVLIAPVEETEMPVAGEVTA